MRKIIATLLSLGVASGIALGTTGASGARISERPQAPEFVDVCGTDSDSFSYVESATGTWHWDVNVTYTAAGALDVVSLQAVPNEGFYFNGPDKNRSWAWRFNDWPCW